MRYVSAIIIFTKIILWKLLRRTRMEDKIRLQTLQEMKTKLSEISPIQARPANHRCIKYCYNYRKLLDDEYTIRKIESAYELIIRRKTATFEDEVIIDEIINAINAKIMDIDTN